MGSPRPPSLAPADLRARAAAGNRNAISGPTAAASPSVSIGALIDSLVSPPPSPTSQSRCHCAPRIGPQGKMVVPQDPHSIRSNPAVSGAAPAGARLARCRSTAVLCAVVLALVSVALSMAQPAHGGTQIAIVNATGGVAILPGTSFSLAPRDESALTATLEPRIRQLIEERGYRIVPDAELRLNYSLTTMEDGDGLLPFGLSGTIGSNSSADITLQIRLPRYWKNRPLVGEPYYLSMSLVGPAGRPIWQGTASTRVRPPLAQDVAGQLAAALIERLGKTVHDETVALD